MSVRRDLSREQPIFAQITAPSTDQSYPCTPERQPSKQHKQSFMDEYGNWIYLTPMVLGGAATLLRGLNFLGIGKSAPEGPLDCLYALVRRIRKARKTPNCGRSKKK